MSIHAEYSVNQRTAVNARDRHGKLVRVGQRVRLVAPHPQASREGVYLGIEWRAAVGKWGYLVELEDGTGCHVFRDEQWERVK